MEKEKIYKGIAYFQLLGGILGLIGLLNKVVSSELNPWQASILSIASLAFVLTAIAGYFLLKGRKVGEPLTIISQFLQLFNFNYLGIKYVYYCGLQLSVYLQGSDIGVGLETGSAFFSRFSQYAGESDFKLNLLAVAILYWIVKNPQQEEEI